MSQLEAVTRGCSPVYPCIRDRLIMVETASWNLRSLFEITCKKRGDLAGDCAGVMTGVQQVQHAPGCAEGEEYSQFTEEVKQGRIAKVTIEGARAEGL